MSEPSSKGSDGKRTGIFLRGRQEHCPRCSYDLRGCNASTCPECGYLVGLKRLSRSRGKATSVDVLRILWAWLLGTFLSMVAIVVIFEAWSSILHQAWGMLIIIAVAVAPYLYVLASVFWRRKR